MHKYSLMRIRLPILVCTILALLMTVAYLDAESRTLGFATKKADRIESQRFEKKIWGQSGSRTFTKKKSFPLKEWDMHFSSIGSKRAPIMLEDGKEKQLFKTKTKTFENKAMHLEMSRWNDRMKDLHKTAGIDMDDKARLVSDQRLYSMMMQDAQRFSEMAEQVSLRDLNRYQFRRNRSDDGIPVEKAGSGQ